jgi:hypothetical protein
MAQPQQWGFQAELVRHAADSTYAFMRGNMLKDVTEGELWAGGGSWTQQLALLALCK